MTSVEDWLKKNVPEDGMYYKVSLVVKWEGFGLIMKDAQVEKV